MSTHSAQQTAEDPQHEVTLDDAFRLAKGHHVTGNLVLAERTYRDILRAVPDHAPTLQMLGVLLFNSGNLEEAAECLRRATEAEPEDKTAWNNYGGILTQAQKYDEALLSYDKALAFDAGYVDAMNNKAYTLWLSGRYREAEKLARGALKIQPDHPVALNSLGISLARLSKYEESLDVWEKLAEINPGEAMLWANWGNCLREMGKLAESEEKCRKAVELNPKNPEALNNLGNVLRDRGKPEEAIDLYRAATNEKPEFYQAHNNMAIALADSSRFEEAVVALRYALAFKPDFAEGHNNMATALTALGDYDKAYHAAQRAIHLDPDNLLAYLEMADILMYRDRNEDGEAAMQEALRREPDSPRAYMKLADIREKMNAFEEAHIAIDKAIEMSPDMPILWLRKAGIYYSDAELEKALEAIEKTIELAPRWPAALVHKADMLVSVNRNEEAESIARQALSLSKKQPGAYHTLVGLRKIRSKDDQDFRDLKALEKDVEGYGQEITSTWNFTMSDLYEQLGEYDLAFDHLKRANEAKRKTVYFEPGKNEQLYAMIRSKFTEESLKRNEERGCPSDIPVFIVGMPRSGTTLTEQIISSHPDVYGAGELPELGRVYRQWITGAMSDPAELGEDYVQRLKVRDKTGKARRITDKMPGNYVHMGLIAYILPNARIIHCKRDPIDNCLSCYKQNFARGQYWSYDLEELAAEYKRYQGMMDHWKSVMPDRFLEIEYEETVNNFEEQARRLIDYVGLEWNDACLRPHEQDRPVLTASKGQVTRPVYKTSVMKWKKYEKHLQPLVKALMPEEALPEG